MKSITNLSRAIVPNELIPKLTHVYKYIGKNFYYDEILKKDKELLSYNNLEKNAYFLALLKELNISENRLRLLIKKKSEPKTNDELFLYNCLESLVRINKYILKHTFSTNDFFDLIQLLYKNTGKRAIYSKCSVQDVNIGLTYIQDGKEILVTTATSKKMLLDALIYKYNCAIESKQYEPILVITNFYIDFINVSPFIEDNEFVAVLAVYMLLYNNGIYIFNFYSFFQKIYNKIDDLRAITIASSYNWSVGFSRFENLYDLFLDIITDLYVEADDYVRGYMFDQTINKSVLVENTIKELGNVFTKREIMNRNKTISESTVNRTLEKLREDNRIKPTGKGRSAKWIKVDSSLVSVDLNMTIEEYKQQIIRSGGHEE